MFNIRGYLVKIIKDAIKLYMDEEKRRADLIRRTRYGFREALVERLSKVKHVREVPRYAE